MKKRILILLMILVFTTAFASCGSNGQTEGSDNNDEQTETVENNEDQGENNNGNIGQMTDKETSADSFLYAENGNDGITIRSYKGQDIEVVIPETIDGKPVTEISEKAFSENGSIVAVRIPRTVESIGEEAFYDCEQLKTLLFSDKKMDSLTIGDKAFYLSPIENDLIISAKELSLGWQVFGFNKSKEVALLADLINLTDDIFPYNEAECVFIPKDSIVTFEEKFINTEGANIFSDMEQLSIAILPGCMSFIDETTFEGDALVEVYTEEGSGTAESTKKVAIPLNTKDYDKVYKDHEQKYKKLGYDF